MDVKAQSSAGQMLVVTAFPCGPSIYFMAGSNTMWKNKRVLDLGFSNLPEPSIKKEPINI